jgi:uncharacterized OB-fold protein
MRQVSQHVRNRTERVRQWAWRCAKQCVTCRACGRTVRPLESICPTCGTSNPVNVPVSPSVLITCFVSVAVLLLLCLT